MEPQLNVHYWDCECPEDYIHAKIVGNYCEKCGTFSEGQPDSRHNEIEAHYNPRYDNAVFKDTPEVAAIHKEYKKDGSLQEEVHEKLKDKFNRVTLAIHFCDLIESTQKDVLDFYGLEAEEDGNFEISPLFILEVADDN